MSNFMGDVSTIYGAYGSTGNNTSIGKKDNNMTLDMTDFLTLMVTELTHQGIDDSMDTTDMLNQMVQMQMVQAMVNMTDASVMSYAASLVGKEVTVANGIDGDGNIIEYTGCVIGTGQYNGDQVVFLDNDKYYKMSEIFAVGRLPAKKDEGTDKTEGVDSPEGGDKTEGTETPEGADKPADEVTKPDESSGTTPEYNGENGAPEQN